VNLVVRILEAVPVFLLACCLALTLWIYWPGHSGPDLLDDRSSVMTIAEDLGQSPELAWDYVFGDASGPLGRPVTMASFVLEKLYMPGGIGRSKQVNIFLHLFNGCLLALLFSRLLRHLYTPGHQWLGLVMAVAWMLTPLHVSTVLYAVQRMAMLGTTFMLSAMLFYALWRERLIAGRFSVMPLLGVFLSILLAILSKENSIVVIPIICMLEVLWFQFCGHGGHAIKWLRLTTFSLIGGGGLMMLVALVISYDSLAASFGGRPFTLEERLLTQARILWDYIGQLFLPEVSRMGLYHDDISVSRSWHEPLSTLYSLLSWVGVLLLSGLLCLRRWGRYFVFALAWYLLGHSVESTVLALELYFEHRNYFPGAGLFLGLGVLLARVIKLWPESGKPILVYAGIYAFILATQTSSQVQIWSSRPLLILNHLNSHPESFRANTDMAVLLADAGDFSMAKKYSAKAFEVSDDERRGDYDIRDIALSCVSNQPVPVARIEALGTTDAARPLSSVTTLMVLVRLLEQDVCPDFDKTHFADRMAEIFIVKNYQQKAGSNMYLSLALLENSMERFDNAHSYIVQFLSMVPEDTRGLLMRLHFATALGRVDESREIIRKLQRFDGEGRLTVGEQQTLVLYLEHP